MQATILDAFNNNSKITSEISAFFQKNGIKYSSFRLADLNILPCRSCGSCSTRTPGKCVQNDDMIPVFRSMAESQLLVYVCPIRFGGYPYQLKKAIDRTMPLGEPFYFVKDGHLLHPMRYGGKYILAVGMIGNNNIEEEDNFKLLVSRNALNMQSQYHVVILRSEENRDSEGIMTNRLKEILNVR